SGVGGRNRGAVVMARGALKSGTSSVDSCRSLRDPSASTSWWRKWSVPAAAAKVTRASNGPSKYTCPSSPLARSQLDWAGADGRGVQTAVIEVAPPGPGAAPAHKSPVSGTVGASTSGASALEISGGAAFSAAFFAAASISASEGAKYPVRALTSTPGRLTRTAILWNLPSAGFFADEYPSR